MNNITYEARSEDQHIMFKLRTQYAELIAFDTKKQEFDVSPAICQETLDSFYYKDKSILIVIDDQTSEPSEWKLLAVYGKHRGDYNDVLRTVLKYEGIHNFGY